jgi:hypothetical protein
MVDVVAASEKLRPSTPPEPVPPPPPKRGDAMEITWACALGHAAPPDSAFCPRCGLPRGTDPALVAVTAEAARPRPAAELSAEELAEREARHAEAIAAAARFEAQPQEFVRAEGEAILIHFIEDGLTAFGQVWYRGQELEIGPSHPRWAEALGWITLDRFAQIERWGKQKFDRGPWPGRRSYADAAGSFEHLSVTAPDGTKIPYAGPSAAELQAADAAEQRRGRAVPAPVYR